MGMSLEEIVFLFTVSGLPWPPSRSVSASLHLYGGGARRSGARRFSQCLKGAVSAPWCISWICISACFHVWAHTICIPQKHLYSGVDPSSVGVHDHLYVSELATMYVNPLPSFLMDFFMVRVRGLKVAHLHDFEVLVLSLSILIYTFQV